MPTAKSPKVTKTVIREVVTPQTVVSEKSLYERLAPIFYAAVVAMAFFVGTLWQKVEYLEKAKTTTTTTGTNAANPQAAASTITVEAIKAFAGEVGVDTGKFNSCLDDGKFESEVTKDFDYGTELGVTGTPGFFINGYFLSGAYPYSVFKDVLDFLGSGGSFDKPNEAVKILVDGNPQNGEIDKTKKSVDLGDAPVNGKANAPITIVEFSDFECPFCSRFYNDTYGAIKKDYVDSGKVRFAYMHYPLSFHPHAQKAAEAAECAKEQGKFWEMHDKLFEVQTAI